ncbi:hypothetical protein evm_004779 [Chilo suppressalis]|nr:hypothetical protein evm_004779 [Chilo suppressalis]
MGVKGLWTVLTPYSEKKSLYEIRGETVAVDLSGWVCDSQNVTDYYVQPKLYLRNLFFRTIYLLLADITPIFVLEGDAPELKRDVMAARNAIQFKGAAPRAETTTSKPDVGRKRFRNVLKECENLLRTMGVRCIKGRGEAEATCAQLNAQGLVDAVISQDSDCFAYGARRVYRNFSVSNAAGGGAMQGSVDCYDAQQMFSAIGFGRNKMVALAMLCGCDYGVGACGSSITTVVSFLHTVTDNEIIPRLISWVSDTSRYDELTRWSAAPGRCDRCGHVGRTHLKNGCPVCATHKGCNDLGHKAKLTGVKRELSLRSRALSCGMPFPEPRIMKEFLNTAPENIDLDKLKTPAPSLIQFMNLMTKKLDWTERYCVVKFLPLLTKWHLQNDVPCRTIKPVAIKKKRNPRGVPSYEVVWADIDGQFEGLIPDDQIEEGEDLSTYWTTTERQDLMRQFYPAVVEVYEDSIKKPPKEKKTRAKKKTDVENPEKPKRKYNKRVKKLIDTEMVNLSGSLKKLDLTDTAPDLNTSKANVSVSINKLKRKIKSNSKKGKQKTIDSFIGKKRRKSSKKTMNMGSCSFKKICDEYDNANDDLVQTERVKDVKNNTHNKENIFSISMLNDSEGDVNGSDISDIIDNIVKRPPEINAIRVDNNLMKLVFETRNTPKKTILRKSVLNHIRNNCSTPKQSSVKGRNSNKDNIDNEIEKVSYCAVNTSYFFDKLTDNRDAFEMSLDYKHKSAIIVDCDTTVDYSLPDVRL